MLRAYLRRWKAEVGVFFDGVGPKLTAEEIAALFRRAPSLRGRGQFTPAPGPTARSKRAVQIIAAARRTLEDEGLDAVTMRRSARR